MAAVRLRANEKTRALQEHGRYADEENRDSSRERSFYQQGERSGRRQVEVDDALVMGYGYREGPVVVAREKRHRDTFSRSRSRSSCVAIVGVSLAAAQPRRSVSTPGADIERMRVEDFDSRRDHYRHVPLPEETHYESSARRGSRRRRMQLAPHPAHAGEYPPAHQPEYGGSTGSTAPAPDLSRPAPPSHLLAPPQQSPYQAHQSHHASQHPPSPQQQPIHSPSHPPHSMPLPEHARAQPHSGHQPLQPLSLQAAPQQHHHGYPPPHQHPPGQHAPRPATVHSHNYGVPPQPHPHHPVHYGQAPAMHHPPPAHAGHHPYGYARDPYGRYVHHGQYPPPAHALPPPGYGHRPHFGPYTAPPPPGWPPMQPSAFHYPPMVHRPALPRGFSPGRARARLGRFLTKRKVKRKDDDSESGTPAPKKKRKKKPKKKPLPPAEESLADAALIAAGTAGPIALHQERSGWSLAMNDGHRRSFISYRKGAFPPERCKMWFSKLASGISWRRPKSEKRGVMPRHTAWLTLHPCSCSYEYGGISVPPLVMQPWFVEIMRAVMYSCGIEALPNSCNANYYSSGKQTVGWHTDDEPLFNAVHEDALIISLSLGATRTFHVRSKDDPDVQEILTLEDGDLCTMEGLMQKHYKHCIPRETAEGARINLTWRWVVKHDSSCPCHKRS
eukprot:TRINITY_DN12904_c0_g1_i1.p1 TRINITY_DN12904_c0_g1~~TRINITY_DN12904_c0_g1_i1.p1  ORF type:complete len:671 (-),score=62.27 TRINITY_DN12904_c0_g1_i1:101-2113(-)